MPDSLDILMATYNGDRFLAPQLDSILAQTRPGLRLLIRDDGSTDATCSILAGYAARHPEIVLLEPEGVRPPAPLGPRGSFGVLLEQARAEYVMFADQDDVWLPGRIDLFLGRMKEAETRWGPGVPVLVHSDLSVVDESLALRSRSFWAYQRLDPLRGKVLNRLLVQNVVTGCASMFNRSLAALASPIPAEAMMHDWWIALVAAALGRIETIAEPTVLYRQHAANRIGAKRPGLRYVLERAAALLGPEGPRHTLRATQGQAAALLERLARPASQASRASGPRLRPEQREAIAAYATLGQQSFFRRRLLLLRHGFVKSGLLRNLGLLALV
jgi:hypothetical protein